MEVLGSTDLGEIMKLQFSLNTDNIHICFMSIVNSEVNIIFCDKQCSKKKKIIF